MKKGSILMVLIAVFATAVVLSPVISAFQGGKGTSTVGYNCNSCHTIVSSSTIEIWASNLTPATGATITVMVNVTGAEADNSPLGVMILSSLSSQDSLPTDTGWQILTDPSGTTAHNYYEIESYSSTASLTWTLKAPDAPDFYSLFASELHGNGERYIKDTSGPLTFNVGNAGADGVPVVLITSPNAGTNVSKEITVSAEVLSEQDIAYALLKIDGELVDNKSSSPFLWKINTEDYSDGEHVITIVAVDAEGAQGSSEITIEIDNASSRILMLNWLATMIAGAIVIVSISGISMVGALLIRRKVMVGKKGGAK